MITLGVNIAIVQSGKILLTRREDFEVWCIPGGIVDPNESLAQAAIREAREETGLEVELLRLVGMYSEIGRGDGVHIALFTGQPVGGSLEPQEGEVLELGYFAPNALPEILWWHRQRVADVFDGAGGSVAWRTKSSPKKRVNSREELYNLRDRSGLSRPEFYRYFFEQHGTDEVVLEVGKIPL
ncbi:MAG: NUDIX domain-containing protein [Anaerolineae bacterium]|nr:NUDIX domain-containing protein [Anaerolineae bacterium]